MRRSLLALTIVAASVAAIASPVAAQPAPADAPTLGMVGDSIPFEALFHFDKTIKRDRRIVFSATGLAYKVRTTLPSVRAEMRQPPGERPDIFLVFLGTSQSQSEPPHVWRRELRQLLDLVSPKVSCIRVFEIDDDRSGFYRLHDRWAPAYNRITRQVTNEYPNAEWYHYELWAGLVGPEYEKRDTLHHNGAGKVQIARLMRHAANTCDPNRQSGPYWDVLDNHPAAAAIAWVGERNLFPGYANGTYRPQVGDIVLNGTRGELLNMTWKLAGRPTGYGPHPWRDGRRALEPALRWAAGERVGTGFRNGTYRPDAVVTRGQAISLLWRVAGKPGGFPDDHWSDADGPAFRWSAANGLLAGIGGGRFGPQRPLSRAAMARLLFRFDRLGG